MRASRRADGLQPAVKGQKEVHISGAEGLHSPSEVPTVVRQYVERALNHPKGKAEKIIVTAELTTQAPRVISALPVSTVISPTPEGGEAIVREILATLGITKRAIREGFEIMQKGGMRGAAMISAEKGTRLEPDRQRGVRVSRLGITRSASRRLSERLSVCGINTDTVKEALLLASKVISHQDVIAEFCISDDPYYTTGYVSSEKTGYVRIPNIKRKKSPTGGRAFFIREGADLAPLITYLETIPVIIGKAAPCKGALPAHEIPDNSHR